MSQKHIIFIAGAGGIGRALGLILRESTDLDCDIIFGDISQEACDSVKAWVLKDSNAFGEVRTVLMPPTVEEAQFEKSLFGCNIILDCLPGALAPKMAKLALSHGMHYANLTEYVAETNEIMEMAKGAHTGLVLQTGLAPGFVGVLANGLFQGFCKDFGVDRVDSVEMKVGALTVNAPQPHFYGFTWSPIGVATEYVKPAVVVRDGKVTERPSLTERETLIIDGVTYEADLTSGGAADLPQALAGRLSRLDYKTIRWPGHYKWVDGLLKQMDNPAAQTQLLEKTMLDQVPLVEDDVVIIYACVKGKDSQGNLRLREKSYRILPKVIGGQTLRAIQTTTAAPIAEVANMLLKGKLKGIVLQSQLDPEAFLNGPFVRSVYG